MAGADPTYVNELIDGALGVVDILIPIAVTLGLLAFFWGIVKFIFSADNAKARETGKAFMVWGVVAVFVMVSALGIIQILSVLFGTGEGGDEFPPGIINITPF